MIDGVDNNFLLGLSQEIAKEFPDIQEIMDQAKAGSLSEMDALRAMSEVMSSDAEVQARFLTTVRKALLPDKADQATPRDHGGLYVHKERGLPQLNPLVEAALIERAQFDDDMPELRTGPMAPGVAPAVSVDTDVRDPALLGQMLQQASKDMDAKILEALPDRQKFIQSMAEASDEAALTLLQDSGSALQKADEARDLVFDGRLPDLDIPEYRRGSVPAPVSIATPSGSMALAMTPQERKAGAWKFLSTTQGRQSGLKGLTTLVNAKLQSEGFQTELRDFVASPTEAVVAFHEWTVGIDGPGAMQPAFNLIDIAATAISKGLSKKMGDYRGKVILEVMAVNTVDIRSVGWAARLLSSNPLLGDTHAS